ncbi:MAG: hypothetical protein AAF791_06475 [Bacteroidota bacterium]
MRCLLLPLLVVVSAGSAAGQAGTVVGVPRCVDTEAVRLLSRGVAGAIGEDAVSTDGFGARLQGGVSSLGAASILNDAPLAWRTPAVGDWRSFICPGRQRVSLPIDDSEYLHLGIEAGNETGDPGPLRYLDPTLPNVDKIGPDYEATLRLPNRAVVSGRWRDFLPTDPAIFPRIADALDGRFPKRKGLSLLAAARVTDQIEVVADGLVAEDLPFEETLGREVPTLRRRLGARVQAHRGWTNAYVVSQTEHLDRPTWSRLGVLGPDWRETVTEAGVAMQVYQAPLARIEDPYGHIAASANVRHRTANGVGLADGSVWWGEAVADAIYSRGLWGASASGALSVGASGVGGQAEGDIFRRFSVRDGLRLRTAASARASRDLPEAAPSLPFWVARGYTGLASSQTPLTLYGVPTPTDQVGVRAEADLSAFDIRPGPRGFDRFASVTVAGGLNATRGETVLLPTFSLPEGDAVVQGSVRAVAASGTLATVEVTGRVSPRALAVDVPPHRFARLTAWILAQRVLSGDAAFRAAWDREPPLRLGALAQHSPDGRLTLNARLEWRAATRWEGWPEPEVPAALLLDLGAERTFGAFTASLTGRNVLGAPEQTHPLGATLDGRLFVRVEARLGGG